MEINVERLIEFSLNIEGYFILNSLYNEETELLDRYCRTIKDKIPTSVFENLVKDGYLEHDGSMKSCGKEKLFNLTNITLTDKFKLEVLKIKDLEKLSFTDAFQQLREYYPTKTPNGARRLQTDIERCKKLYKNVIAPAGIVDAEKHSLILQCVNFMLRETSKKSDGLNYLQAFPTYLQQRNWESVEEDVLNIIKNNGNIEKKSPFGERDEGGNKTQLGSEAF